MAAKAAAKQSRDTVPQDAPSSSPTPYSGHHDHSFTLQSIMEIQKAIGVMDAKLDNVNATMQSTKSKVDDLVGWKNKILGGAIVLGAVCALAGVFITKFSEYITITPPNKAPTIQQAPPSK